MRAVILFIAIPALLSLQGNDFLPPGGNRYATHAASGTILPGGRVLRPYGVELETGAGTAGLAVNREGTVATADSGPERYSVTVIDPPRKSAPWSERHIWARTPGSQSPGAADPAWNGVSSGIAFETEKTLWVSEGASGKIRQLDINAGDRGHTLNLNDQDWRNSFSGDLLYDSPRHLLFAVDPANQRIAVIDPRRNRVLASVKTNAPPAAEALSPDGQTLWVAEADAVCNTGIADPLQPAAFECITVRGIPSAILTTDDKVFISSSAPDAITVVSVATRKVLTEIPLTIPSLEQYSGVAPQGLAFDPVTKWLLVAEAGINALGVIDTTKNEVVGQIPTDWMPVKVALAGDRVYVANFAGHGTGPRLPSSLRTFSDSPLLHRGTVTTFILPQESEVLDLTRTAFSGAGLVPDMHDPPTYPGAIRHVVMIVKGNHTYDDLLGDITRASNGPVAALVPFARYGMHARARGAPGQFSIQDAAITPNHHALATQWGFSDNFYAVGAEPDGAGPDYELLRAHAQKFGISVYRTPERAAGSGSISGSISDDEKTDQVIADLEQRYRRSNNPLPQLIYITLQGDITKAPDAGKGFPYEASYVADNDRALGRLIEYLSHSPWWPEMTVFVTEENAESGLDHVDSHRTLLLAAGPFVKRNYASHRNSNFPGLLKTVFELLHVMPLNLGEATAADLRDLFTTSGDFSLFTAQHPDVRILPDQPGAATN